MFVRQDIPLQHQIVQACHASLSLGSWMEIDGIPNLVLIGVPDQAGLMSVKEELEAGGIDYLAWEEPDYDFGLTSIATEPLTVERKAILRKYKLWRPTELHAVSLVA